MPYNSSQQADNIKRIPLDGIGVMRETNDRNSYAQFTHPSPD